MRTNGPGQSALLLLDIIAVLQKLDVPYVIVGAFAASFHGAVRASLDADAVISISNDQNQHLLGEFENMKLRVSSNKGDMDDPVQAVINIEDEFCNRVDLLLGIRGMEEGVFDRAISASFMDSTINIIGIEDFIAMKVFAGSHKDIQDVIGVIEISGDKIDLSLSRDLTARYGQQELVKLEELLKEYYKD